MSLQTTKPFGYGIIGAGRVAQEHVKGALAAGGSIAGIFDIDRTKAASLATFAAQQGAKSEPIITGSIDELCSMTNVSGVVVSVPNFAHSEVAITCLNNGKDVLLEKPMAMTVAQCDEVIAAMQQAGCIVQMGFVCRGSAKVHAVREIIQSGRLGNIYHVKASAYRQRGIPGLGGWFTTKAMSGGGVLVDIAVHLIDLVMHLTDSHRAVAVSGVCESRFGSPIDRYVYEEMWAGPPRLDGVCDVEDSAMGLIRFDNEMTCELNVAWASNMPHGLLPDGVLLLGDRGGLFFDIWSDRLTLTTQRDGKVGDEQIAVSIDKIWERAWQWQHERFIEAVRTRSEPVSPASCGRAVQQVLAAWQQSAGEHREVVISAP